MDFVPSGSRVLDVGCGAGLFLGLLAASRTIRQGYGFDASARAIKLAREVVGADEHSILTFEQIDADDPWPDQQFDVVSMIDVMHHIPRSQRENIIVAVAERLVPGGLFLYKDVGRRPVWRAWASRLHDLVFAREWIDIASVEEVQSWTGKQRLELVHFETINMLWYGHELCLFKKMT
jgi:2-polyprenyl-3-methyl-5-hydroxy-6-metoxy-1,4-benzoquinol methylase